MVRNGEIIHNAIQENSNKETQQSQLAEAKEEAGTAIKAKIIDILKGIFSKPAKTEQDRVKVERLRKLTEQFMHKCRIGIIDFEDILSSPTNKIDDLVDPGDLVIYNFIKREAFNAVPGTTAGAWGPGEIGLSMLATPVTKGEIGGALADTAIGGGVGLLASTVVPGAVQFVGKGLKKAGEKVARYAENRAIAIAHHV